MSRWADWFPLSSEEGAQLIAACSANHDDDAVNALLEPWLDRAASTLQPEGGRPTKRCS
jgi:hypothetical protein